MKIFTPRKNNRKASASRKIQLHKKYSLEQIKEAQSSIEKARRARCLKNIKLYI